MSALAIRCPLCGSDNLFPAKYAGRTLSCSHCGESLPVVSAEDPQVPTSAQTPATPQVVAETTPRATGMRRLTKAFCHGLCILCFLVIGLVGGGWAGIALASQAAIGGSVLAVITCPIGAFIGLWLAVDWMGHGRIDGQLSVILARNVSRHGQRSVLLGFQQRELLLPFNGRSIGVERMVGGVPLRGRRRIAARFLQHDY